MDHGPRTSRPAFTLVEILVAIGIIVILIGLLIPVVNKVRTAAREASVRSQLSVLAAAIKMYEIDFRAYPGPLSNDEVGVSITIPIVVNSSIPAGTFATTPDINNEPVTMAENLVLGLLGGLRFEATNIVYDPSAVGGGASHLGASPKKSRSYIESNDLSWNDQGNGKTGKFYDDASTADPATDSIIPEFVDRYQNPMPILYMRARVGAPDIVSDAANDNNVYQYDLNQIEAYTKSRIGVGKDAPEVDYTTANPAPEGADPIEHGLNSVTYNASMDKTDANYVFPFDLYPYLEHPTASNATTRVPREKDGYILISAGTDRIYGTKDDICNFGGVEQ